MALAFCSMFVGCSDDDEWMSYADAKVQAFDEAFTKIYGQIDPRQDWGFGIANQANYTREVNANANEWADPNKSYGGLLVPPALTEEQIAVVKAYFQAVPNLGYEDPQWTNYFIQQVYKGNPKTAGANSTEAYKAANGSTDIIGSDHMDHLAAIDESRNFVDHINNFNHGDCSTNGSVLDNGGNANDGPFHSDKIMYMKESTTKSFGYYNSNSSVRRTEYTGLVSWKTIRTWANANNLNGDCLDDKWNRSFMGFDFEMLADKEMYSTTKYDVQGNIVYSGDFDHEVINYFSIELNNQDKVWNGSELVDATTVGEVITDQWGGKKLYPYMPGTTEKVPLLSENKNQYAGTPDAAWNGTDWEHYIGSTKYTSIEKMVNALKASKLPTNQYSWVKIGGTADGYYSDWIVTLTAAKRKGNVLLVKEEDGEYTGTVEYWRKGSVKSGRIFVEDLARTGRGDIDFNDAVFDAHIYDVEVTKIMKKTDGTEIGTMSEGPDQFTQIDVLACGGTLPLTIAGTEVHSLFGVSTTTMVNTIGKNSVLREGYSDHNVKTIPRAPYYESLSGIKVAVKVNDKEVMELNNYDNLGKAPHMICVPLGTPWPQERVAIGPEKNGPTDDCAFPDFANYVGNASLNPWDNINQGKVYEWNPEITPVSSTINEKYLEKDTTYTGTIKTEYTVEVTQAIPTPEGTVVYTGSHQFKDGGDGTDLIIQANDFSNAGLAIGKLRIYGVGYEGQHKDGTGWKLYISGVGDWMTPSTNPELKSQGYIEIDITSNNLDIFRRTVTIQGQAFNILAITVI